MKVIVYTCLYGNYDALPPMPVEVGVDYFIFTDAAAVPAPWQKRSIGNVTMSARRFSRLPKIMAHRYLPAHDVSIYVDANLHFKKPFAHWAVEQIGVGDLGICRHPRTRCLYEEGEKCWRLGLDTREIIEPQLDRYRAAGFPINLGLTENSFIVRRDTKWVRQLNEGWWEQYAAGSHRDQLSLMFALWKLERLNSLLYLPVHSRHNDYWSKIRHRGTNVVCTPVKRHPFPKRRVPRNRRWLTAGASVFRRL